MNLLQNWVVTEHVKVAVEGPCLIGIIMDPEHKKFAHFSCAKSNQLNFEKNREQLSVP